MPNKIALLLINLFFAAGISKATTISLVTVTQPIFYGGADEEVKYLAIPKLVNHQHPEFMAYQYSSPTYAQGHNDIDLNLISQFGITVRLTRTRLVKGTNKATEDRARQFTIDVSNLKLPKGWKLTPLQAGQIAAKAVRTDFKDVKATEIVITDGKTTWKAE